MASTEAAPLVRRGASAFMRDLAALPNLVSIARVLLVYAALAFLWQGRFGIGLAIGVVAGLTDYLDGYLARKLGLSTPIGALLDQVADVLFITGSILLFVVERAWPPILLYVVLFREFIVLNLRASAAQMGFSIPSVFLGKLASNFLFYALGFMAVAQGNLYPPATQVARWIADFGVYGGTLLSVVTGCLYVRSYAQRYVSSSGPSA